MALATTYCMFVSLILTHLLVKVPRPLPDCRSGDGWVACIQGLPRPRFQALLWMVRRLDLFSFEQFLLTHPEADINLWRSVFYFHKL